MGGNASQGSRVADAEENRLTLLDTFRGVYVLFSVLGLLLAISNFSRNFLDSIQWLIAMVDLYRGITHPLAEAFFEAVWPQYWEPPGKDFIDLFFMLFFIKSAQNASRMWSNWQTRQTMPWDLRVNFVFLQFWGPFYFSMAIFGLHLLFNFFSIHLSAAQVLFLFGVYYFVRCLLLGHQFALPRVIDNPYYWYRMRFRKIPLPHKSLRDRGRDAILYLTLPILIELNNHADLTLPIADRFARSIESSVESLISLGRRKRESAALHNFSPASGGLSRICEQFLEDGVIPSGTAEFPIENALLRVSPDNFENSCPKEGEVLRDLSDAGSLPEFVEGRGGRASKDYFGWRSAHYADPEGSQITLQISYLVPTKSEESSRILFAINDKAPYAFPPPSSVSIC